MKGITIFWKTWIVTTGTVFLSMLIALLVFGVLTTAVYRNQTINRIEKDFEQAQMHLSLQGIDEDYLIDLGLKGYTLFVTGPEGLVFPKTFSEGTWIAFSSLTETELARETIPEESEALRNSEQFPHEEGMVHVISAADMELFVRRVEIEIAGELYEFEMFWNNQSSTNVLAAFITVFPSVVLTGLAVSLFAAYIYARYLSNRIKRLDDLALDMSRMTAAIDHTQQDGDELQRLENRLHQMYQSLTDTLKVLDAENAYIKKLEADKRFFMRGATHELKTPIMMMNIVLEDLIEEGNFADDIVVRLQSCYGSLQTMTKLVNDILRLSELEQVKVKQKIDVKPIVTEVLETYSYGIEDKVLKVDIILDAEQCLLTIAPKYARTVFSNLIGNAVKYTPENGRLSIRVSESEIVIENDSTYYSAADLARLVEPFVSGSGGDEVGAKSHGLGLYIVDEVFKRCEIVYDIQMNKQKGTFRFVILPKPEIEMNRESPYERS